MAGKVNAGMPTEETDTIRADLSSIIHRTQAPKLKSSQENDNIIILPTGKGRATVILNKEDYIRKYNEHLENGPCIKIKKDPTNSVVSQITRKRSVLRDNKLIDQQQYLNLRATGSQPPRFYNMTTSSHIELPYRLTKSWTY